VPQNVNGYMALKDSEEEMLCSGTSSHDGTAKVGNVPVTAGVAAGQNVKLRWGQLKLSLRVKRPLGSSFEQAENDDLLAVKLVQV